MTWNADVKKVWLLWRSNTCICFNLFRSRFGLFNMVNLVKLFGFFVKRLLIGAFFGYYCIIILLFWWIYTLFKVNLLVLNFMLLWLRIECSKLLAAWPLYGRVFNFLALLGYLKIHSIRPQRSNSFLIWAWLSNKCRLILPLIYAKVW